MTTKKAPKRAKSKAHAAPLATPLVELSFAVWVLGRDADANEDPAVQRLGRVLEAVAHAIDPENTIPRELTSAERRRAREALDRMQREAVAYLRARLGAERGLTKADTYDNLLSRVDALLAKGCTLRALEIAAGSAVAALGYALDPAILKTKIEKTVATAKRDGAKTLDRGRVMRDLLAAAGMPADKIREIQKARSKRERRADTRD